MSSRSGEQFEGQGLQGIAGQQCIGLAELHMHRGLAAAQHVVVHARQVVVHQRIGMDQLGRAGRAQRGLGLPIRRLAGGEDQQGPQPLAAVEHRIAHRIAQQHGRIDADPLRERGLDARQQRFAPGCEAPRVPAQGVAGTWGGLPQARGFLYFAHLLLKEGASAFVRPGGAHSPAQALRPFASSTLI
jgi:hypothetical protein